ncbi:MAG: hypothetical protein SGARI_002158 [Bacillariaceae sp.]
MASSTTTATASSPMERMNDYKGGSFPAPIIPLTGAALGMAVPWMLVRVSTNDNTENSSVFATIGPSFAYVAVLFLREFLFGAAARSTSTKASFSPSAMAASGHTPFEIIRANRIHQNHLESLAIFVPSLVAAAAAMESDSSGEDKHAATIMLRARVVAWVLFRMLYRIGYCYENNPFWRITGVTASQIQSFACLWMWFSHGGMKW